MRLAVPAAEVWAGTGFGWLAGTTRQNAVLPNTGHPEEELLAGLGAAARLFPALDGALREAAPAQVALDTEGALEFLRETGPLLSGAGFGVLLPDWARKARLGLRLTARSSSSGSSASASSSGESTSSPTARSYRKDTRSSRPNWLCLAELAR